MVFSPVQNRKLRFHLLGLVHLPVSRRYMACAFTQKIEKLSRMLLGLGHEVFLYGAEGSDAPCTEFIQTHSLNDIRDTWGSGDNRFDIGYDYINEQFRHDLNEPPHERTLLTQKYYAAAISEINKRKRVDDFLLLTQGYYQKPIDEGVGLWLTVEPGIGYRGSYARFRAFESAYMQNFTYGSQFPYQSIDGHYYDRVIPNYFDPGDFPFCAKECREDYFLYIGRVIVRKGVSTAIKVCEILNKKLIVAGTGDLDINSPVVERFGHANVEERAHLMSRAQAIFVPTIYLEPFAGVHIEAMMCGTPAITTDFGVFPETVRNGVNGYRCQTLNDFVQAARLAPKLDNQWISYHAQEHYSMDSVAKLFNKWFNELHDLYRSAHEEGALAWHRVSEEEA